MLWMCLCRHEYHEMPNERLQDPNHIQLQKNLEND